MNNEATTEQGFTWFYRTVEPDHVIALCSGHDYLAGRGWQKGEGDLAPLRPADGCCACMGTATIRRMRGAPLRHHARLPAAREEVTVQPALTQMNKIELKVGSRTHRFECERTEQGVAINPVLPEHFDDTDNNHRPARHMAWWNVPYILEHVSESGATYELRCLNGGAWDRSTWCGLFPTLATALEEVPNATRDYGEAARERSHRLHAEAKAQKP